jgi:hypothetical protein
MPNQEEKMIMFRKSSVEHDEYDMTPKGLEFVIFFTKMICATCYESIRLLIAKMNSSR